MIFTKLDIKSLTTKFIALNCRSYSQLASAQNSAPLSAVMERTVCMGTACGLPPLPETPDVCHRAAFEGDNRLQYAISAVQNLSDFIGLNLSVFNNGELMTKYPDLRSR